MRGERARTASMAFLTRSELMRPFLARLEMSAVLVEPDENQAMVAGSVDGEGCQKFCGAWVMQSL